MGSRKKETLLATDFKGLKGLGAHFHKQSVELLEEARRGSNKQNKTPRGEESVETIKTEETIMEKKTLVVNESPRAKVITHKDVAAYIMDDKNAEEVKGIQERSGDVVAVVANMLIKTEVERSVAEAIKQNKLDKKDEAKALVSRYTYLQSRFENELTGKEVINTLAKAAAVALATVGAAYTGMAIYGWYQQRNGQGGTDAFATRTPSTGKANLRAAAAQ